MSLRQSTTCNRLSALGIPQAQVHQLINQYSTWKAEMGQEAVVERLKYLKNFALRALARQDPPSQPVPWCDPYKGPFGKLVKDVISGNHRSKCIALNALMIYTTDVIEGPPTPKQWKKFQSSVEQDQAFMGRNVPNVINSLAGDKGWKRFRFMLYSKAQNPRRLGILSDFEGSRPESFPWSPSTRAPLQKGSCPEDRYDLWGPDFFRSTFNRNLAYDYADLLGKVLQLEPWDAAMPPMASNALIDLPISERKREGYVGSVGFIQEPGCKLRAVANPNRLVQLMLNPLKRYLLDVLRDIPEDCTHDQGKGVGWCQDQIKKGTFMYSIDLSDATNNFPLEFQQLILDDLCVPDLEKGLFNTVSRGPWRVHDPIEKVIRPMRWTNGQPLGLGPSFPLFALSHHLIARATLGAGNYRILGDDIVTSVNPSRYLTVLAGLGVPISRDKTFSSNSLCEFAGKVITPDGILPTVKWRNPSDNNFLDVCRVVGLPMVNSLPPRQRAVAKAIAYIPAELGGLGFNPKGLPLEERIDMAIHSNLLSFQESEIKILKRNSTVPLSMLHRMKALQILNHDGIMISASAGSRPGNPTVDLTSPTINVIERNVGVTQGVYSQAEHRPELHPVVKQTSDPRGQSLLVTLETKLGIAPKPPKGGISR